MNSKVAAAIGDMLTFVEDQLDSLGMPVPQINEVAKEPETRLGIRITSLANAGRSDVGIARTLNTVGFGDVLRIFDQACSNR